MFTVKHIQHGIENLYPNVLGVTFRNSEFVGPSGVEILTASGTLFWEGSKQEENIGCSDGIQIYVMNDNGKTVSQYRLEPHLERTITTMDQFNQAYPAKNTLRA